MAVRQVPKVDCVAGLGSQHLAPATVPLVVRKLAERDAWLAQLRALDLVRVLGVDVGVAATRVAADVALADAVALAAAEHPRRALLQDNAVVVVEAVEPRARRREPQGGSGAKACNHQRARRRSEHPSPSLRECGGVWNGGSAWVEGDDISHSFPYLGSKLLTAPLYSRLTLHEHEKHEHQSPMPATSGAGVVYDVGSWRLGDDGSIYRRGRLKYSNGDLYDGEWLNSKRHGKGTLKFAANADIGSAAGSYIGDFADNFFHGFGILTIAKSQHPLTKKWIQGERYEGDFAQGRKHGRGTLKTHEGDCYDGQFVDGYYHGKGSCTYANGDVYEGDWVHGKWQSQGELRLRDGSKYVGEFQQGLYYGFGQFLFGSGGKLGSYVGDFVYGKRQGKGVRVFGGGSGTTGTKRYEGEWADNEPHGVGVLECATFKLVGRFVRGRECGHGAMSFANGESYEGGFDDGHFSGHGVFVYCDGGKYDGHFLKSKRHGKGHRVFANGGLYYGDWVDDAMHGHGTLTSVHMLPKGRGTQVYEGAFERGAQTGGAVISYTYTPFNAASRFEWKDEYEFPWQSGFWHCGRGASTYVGRVLRGSFHGKGTLRSPDGRLWTGEWVQGKMAGVGERVYFPLEVAAILERERDRERQHNNTANSNRVSEEAKRIPPGTKLYRILRYEGEFVENVRHGNGQLLYENGDRIIGEFVNGFANGIVKYRFSGSGKDRFAEFFNGKRTRWLPQEDEDTLREQENAVEQARETEDSQRKCVIPALVV